MGHRLITDNYIKTFKEYQNWLEKHYDSMSIQVFNKDKVINKLIDFLNILYILI